MKNNKAFTLVEMLVSFTLAMVLVIVMFQLIINLKELYISSGLKTELLNKQYIITNKIYSDLNEKKLAQIQNCNMPEICILFTFNDGSTKTLEADTTNKTLAYGGYKIKLNKDSYFKKINVNTELYDNNRKIFKIDIPIANNLYKKTNFGIDVVYQYNSSDVVNTYQDKFITSNDMYDRIAYIQSTGTQYINLGYKAKTNTEVQLDFELIENANTQTAQTNATNIIGRDNNTSNNAFTVNIGEAQNESQNIYYWVDKTYTAGGEIKSDSFMFITRRSTMSFQSGLVVYQNVRKTLPTKTEDNTDNMILLGTYNPTEESITPFVRYDAKVYGMKIYEGTTLVKNLMPVKSHNSNVCGLYDTVNETFYTNNGTGSFECANTQYIAEDSSYTQIPYIRSTGAQYINLGYKAKTNTETRLDIDLIENSNTNNASSSGYVTIIGKDAAASDNTFQVNLGGEATQQKTIFYWVDKTYASGAEPKSYTYQTITGKSIMTLKSELATFHGENFALPTKTADNIDNMILLGGYNSSVPGIVAFNRYDAKIYGFQIFEGTTLVKNMMPVKSNTTNVCGLYDTINATFYPSTSTTDFECD